MYYLDDEEVEFEKIINQPLPKIPRPVEFIGTSSHPSFYLPHITLLTRSGHWLAIEGVQPAIVQNPTPADFKNVSDYPTSTAQSSGLSSNLATTSDSAGVETKQQVKHVLSKELQLYFEKIGNALMNEETENIRETAIASLRNDPGLHQLVPYLVAFIAEKVSVSLNDRFSVFERRVTDDE